MSMRLNLKKPLIIFDLDTTGLDLEKDRIIQVAYLKVFPDGREVRRNFLVNPGIEIKPEITAITSISNDDVKDKPSFKMLSQTLLGDFTGCDFAGFNSNHFDIPMLAEEFLRAGVDFDFSKCNLVDVQTIYHKMEPRNLSAAYKYYCGRKITDDFKPHLADNDTEATYRVLLGQLDMYNPDNQEEPERCLSNDITYLASFSKTNDNVDFAGRIIWKPILDHEGNPKKDAEGNVMKQEVFNFGKYKGCVVADILHKDPGYYSWVLNGEFTYNTKQVLTRIRLREFNLR